MEHFYEALSNDTKDKIINSIKTLGKIPETHGCFGIIASRFNRDEPFCFGFQINETVADKFIEDFNSKFNNIKLEKVMSVELHRYKSAYGEVLYYTSKQPGKEYYRRNYNDTDLVELTDKYNHFVVSNFVLFTCKFNKHHWKTQFAFYPVIGELIRTFASSACYTYNKKYSPILAESYEGNLLEFAWEIDQNNKNNCIKVASDIKYLYMFDNVELANKAFNVSDIPLVRSNYHGHVYLDFGSLIYPTIAIERLMGR